MQFKSLNTIIDDIMLEYRDSNISESEDLSRIQVEQWIHYYRAYLIRQDINKGYDINEDYIQAIGPIHISEVTNKIPGKVEYISDDKLPSFIDLRYGTGLVSVKDMFGNVIQVGNETKAKYQRSRKYTCNDYIAFLKNNYLYLEGPGYLEYVEISGILENPADAGKCFDADNSPYPVPAHMIPTIKDLIFTKELNIMSQMLTDTTNNSRDDLKKDSN